MPEDEFTVKVREAGIDPDKIKLAFGEQWVSKVVALAVEQIVKKPEVLQSIIEKVIETIKAKL